jgi:hypothetical protein
MSKKEILIQAAEIIRNEAQKDLERIVSECSPDSEAYILGMNKNVLYTDTVDSLIKMIKEA